VQKSEKKIIWASSARNGKFRVFFEKNGIGSLGVNRIIHKVKQMALQLS
jgi:hypothetical protein